MLTVLCAKCRRPEPMTDDTNVAWWRCRCGQTNMWERAGHRSPPARPTTGDLLTRIQARLRQDPALSRSRPRYTMAEMERIVAGYASRSEAPEDAAPLVKPREYYENDSQYTERVLRRMQGIVSLWESDAYYQRAQHNHAMARAGLDRVRRALGY